MTKAVTTEDRMTINQVAEKTGADPKSLRAYLRRHFARQAEVKGSRWGDAKGLLTKTQTSKLVEHFTPEPEAQEAKAS